MHENHCRCSLWLFRGSLALFVLSLMLPITPETGWRIPCAVAFFYVPIGAFVAWFQILYGGFDPHTLLWASLLSLVTIMNGFVFLAPFLRDALEERAGLVSVALAMSIVAVVVLFEAEAGWPNPLQWGMGVWIWIAAFVSMTASYASNYFVGVPVSSSASFANHDGSL